MQDDSKHSWNHQVEEQVNSIAQKIKDRLDAKRDSNSSADDRDYDDDDYEEEADLMDAND